MNTFMILLILTLPFAAFAADTDCRIKETVERYEVVCEGEPVKALTSPSNVNTEPLTRGKHRPVGGRLEKERTVRTKTIMEQRQQESDPPSANGR